ncbi:MAG: GGDEF domain-containing protein [Candidatus Omnitrophica bacterium]|nr:GGDEF domain-containing protein [Candidatus Omnitrophota bacterium]
MERDRKLLVICKYASILLIVILILFYAGYLQPLKSFKTLFRSAWLLIVVCGGLLYLIFTLVEFYYKRILEYNAYLRTFHNFQLEAVPTMTIEDLSVKTLDVLSKIFKGTTAIFIINDDELKKFVKNNEFIINSGSSQKKAVNKEKVYHVRTFYPGLLTDENKASIEDTIKKYGLNKFSTIAIVPFANDKNLIATGIVAFEKPAKDFFEYIKEPVEIFSKQVSSIFESAVLHQKITLASITDPLTGLYNKRYFQQRIKEEFSKAKRNHFPISVIISDFDNFKFYVDKYGHPLTDVLLAQFGAFVKKLLRESDIICRFGGDEFVYLLPFSDSLEAYRVGERIKNEVVSREFLLGDENRVYITMSFGIASYPEHGDTWEEVVKNADRALFISKEQGKNRITIYKAE